jgi:hypothetical protein
MPRISEGKSWLPVARSPGRKVVERPSERLEALQSAALRRLVSPAAKNAREAIVGRVDGAGGCGD